MNRGTKLISSAPYRLTPLADKKPRSRGWHCGAIIQDLGQKLGLLPRRRAEVPGRKEILFEMGFVFEDLLEAQFKIRMASRRAPDKVVRQQEIKLDDIYLTPDGVGSNKKERWLEEYKLTFSKAPADPAKLLDTKWAWRVQTQCYAHALKLTSLRLFVAWVGAFPPEARLYEFEFDPTDAARTWNMVSRHRDRLAQQTKG